jgi:uncharacterized membrane protein YdbT with pleckstrin-like domain
MSYLSEKVLTPGEVEKVKPEKNSIFLVLKWVWGILGCWLLLIPTIQAIKATVEFCTTEYLVTDKRVLEKYGWIATHSDDMPLTKIENITVNYSFWGKIFNFGDVCIQGANRNNVRFTRIKDAETIKKQINNLL